VCLAFGRQLRGLLSVAVKEFAGAALEQEVSARASLRAASGLDLASKQSVDGVNVSGKVVFLRADLDVPMRQIITKPPKQPRVPRKGRNAAAAAAAAAVPAPEPVITWEVADDSKILAALPTLHQLIKGSANVIVVAANLGQGRIPASYVAADGSPCLAVNDTPLDIHPVAAALQVCTCSSSS
jgi:hypothetical protein